MRKTASHVLHAAHTHCRAAVHFAACSSLSYSAMLPPRLALHCPQVRVKALRALPGLPGHRLAALMAEGKVLERLVRKKRGTDGHRRRRRERRQGGSGRATSCIVAPHCM